MDVADVLEWVGKMVPEVRKHYTHGTRVPKDYVIKATDAFAKHVSHRVVTRFKVPTKKGLSEAERTNALAGALEIVADSLSQDAERLLAVARGLLAEASKRRGTEIIDAAQGYAEVVDSVSVSVESSYADVDLIDASYAEVDVIDTLDEGPVVLEPEPAEITYRGPSKNVAMLRYGSTSALYEYRQLLFEPWRRASDGTLYGYTNDCELYVVTTSLDITTRALCKLQQQLSRAFNQRLTLAAELHQSEQLISSLLGIPVSGLDDDTNDA